VHVVEELPTTVMRKVRKVEMREEALKLLDWSAEPTGHFTYM